MTIPHLTPAKLADLFFKTFGVESYGTGGFTDEQNAWILEHAQRWGHDPIDIAHALYAKHSRMRAQPQEGGDHAT